jgi:branched-chain amino acid transport system permease protein
MINRECGIYQTTYEGDMALYPVPLARYASVASVAALLLLPLVLDSHAMALVNLITLAAIGAIGLNILVGYTGQVSLGHGAFMMVGSYTAAIFTVRYDVPFWLGLPLGGAMAALVGAFFGIPSLRIKGLYLAIATLAAQFIIEWLINHSTWISPGAQATIYTPTPTLFGWKINTEFRRFYMILPVAVIAYVGALNLVRSRVGRAFIAVRDRDVAAEIIGVNIFKYKLLAFAVSSFYAGVAGALWTYYLKIANYEHFTLGTSVQYLAMIIIGGLGSVLGSVFGAVFITLLPIVLVYVVEGLASLFGFEYAAIANFLANLRLIIFGALIILFLAIEPEGLYRLWGNVRRYFRLWPFSY